jgi:galactonate dehydratase
MKIVDCKTFVVGNPPPGFGGRYFIFVKLTTDDGISGIGEIYSVPFDPHLVAKMAEDVAERYLIGSDPHHIEAFWRKAHGTAFTLRPDVSMMGLVSGLEMACWDIVGKAAGKPVYELLGGRVHERLRSYTYIYPNVEAGESDAIYKDAQLSATRAAEYVAMGFTAVKFDPVAPYGAFDPRQPSQAELRLAGDFCRLVRDAVGDKADLLFGTHGQFTVSGAVRLAKVLEPYDPLWFEEPTPPEMPEMMAEVARKTSVPIATGERLATKYEFQRVLATGAASILQFDLGRVGGILEAKKIASMAESHYAQIAPHCYCGPVVGAANIQVAACSPNFLILESIQTWGGFYAELLKTPIRWEEGYVIPSGEPGLGVELNEAVALAHPYRGRQLHLEMTNRPIG